MGWKGGCYCWGVRSDLLCLLTLWLGFLLPACRTRVYTNHWAVRISGGLHEANRIASKYGYINIGQVTLRRQATRSRPLRLAGGRTTGGQRSWGGGVPSAPPPGSSPPLAKVTERGRKRTPGGLHGRGQVKVRPGLPLARALRGSLGKTPQRVAWGTLAGSWGGGEEGAFSSTHALAGGKTQVLSFREFGWLGSS